MRLWHLDARSRSQTIFVGGPQRLAHEPGVLFEIAERYLPCRIADAVTHVSQAARTGVVLMDLSKGYVVLLRHKFLCGDLVLIGAAQHGHRDRVW